MKAMILMYGRVITDKKEHTLFLEGPFYGGRFEDEEAIKDKVTDLNKEFKGQVIIPKIFDAEISLLTIYDRARKHLDAIYQDLADSYRMSLMPKRRK